MCQTHFLSTSNDSANPTDSGDSNAATNAVTGPGTGASPPSEEAWVVDTITLAEYEAQLKTQGESASNSTADSTAKAVADAYFDRFSLGEIDASIVAEKALTPDAAGAWALQQPSTTVPQRENFFAPDEIVPPSQDSDPAPKAKAVNVLTDSSTTNGGSAADLNALGTLDINAQINETVAAFDETMSDSLGTTSEGKPIVNVIETANSDRTSALNNNVNIPFLVAVSLGLPLGIMLLMWGVANLLSWRSRMRENRTPSPSVYAHQDHQWGTNKDDGGIALEHEKKQQDQGELSNYGFRKNTTFKKVAFPKRENKISEQVASSNELLQSQLQDAQETLALVKANSRRRDSEFRAKAKRLNEQLSAKTEDVKMLRSDLSTAKRTIALGQSNDQQLPAKAEGDKRNVELINQVDRLKEELSNKTSDFNKLESDYQRSQQSLAATQARAIQREKELLIDLERLGDEFSGQKANSTKLEAGLVEVQKLLDCRAGVEQELRREHQVKVEEFKKNLNTQSDIIAKLESNLLTSEKALAAAHANDKDRGKEWQIKLELLEEDLSIEKAASSRREAEMSVLKETLEDQQTNEAQRVTELQADLTQVEQEAEQLRLELAVSQEAVAESEEKLAVSKSKVSKLTNELSIAAVNRSNYMKLAKKVVRYKKLYRANEEEVKGLVEQNAQLSDLASEYLESAGEMIEKLSAQAKQVADLKRRMLQPDTGKAESSVLSGDDLQNAKPNDLISCRNTKDAFALKEGFTLGRDDDAFVTPTSQPGNVAGTLHRVNRPR